MIGNREPWLILGGVARWIDTLWERVMKDIYTKLA